MNEWSECTAGVRCPVVDVPGEIRDAEACWRWCIGSGGLCLVFDGLFSCSSVSFGLGVVVGLLGCGLACCFVSFPSSSVQCFFDGCIRIGWLGCIIVMVLLCFLFTSYSIGFFLFASCFFIGLALFALFLFSLFVCDSQCCCGIRISLLLSLVGQSVSCFFISHFLIVLDLVVLGLLRCSNSVPFSFVLSFFDCSLLGLLLQFLLTFSFLFLLFFSFSCFTLSRLSLGY